jgi:indolepyruvate ferredoxin oxidoreductase beta subunit
MKTLGTLVTGVGGQGIILASDIICEAAITAGYDVKKTDTLGMAQRGGSVLSHVRIGTRVFSPLIREGEVDLLLAFEKLEAARWVNYLHRESVVIVNNYAQPPLAVNLGNEKYPDDDEIKKLLSRRMSGYYFVDGNNEAAKAGDSRALNTYMLGCASCFLPIENGIWEDMITQRVPARYKEINMKAFEAGRKEMNNVSRR